MALGASLILSTAPTLAQDGRTALGFPTTFNPTQLAVDWHGGLFVTDRDNDRVRRIGIDAVITTVAGNGETSFSGDGGPATETGLNPGGLAVDSEGNLYISDAGNHRVRRVGPDGVIETIAGSGQAGSDGDGGPATQATLTFPDSLMLDAAMTTCMWATRTSNRIRRVSPDGTMTTFAGTGEAGYGGDGGSATEATLRLAGDPASLAIDAFGNIYIGDSGNHVIRIVDSAGTIATLDVAASPDETPRTAPDRLPDAARERLHRHRGRLVHRRRCGRRRTRAGGGAIADARQPGSRRQRRPVRGRLVQPDGPQGRYRGHDHDVRGAGHGRAVRSDRGPRLR